MTNYSERLQGFEAWLQEQLKRWNAPGAAIGIIADGEIILAEGYGLRDVEKNLPVDADTLFAIGSCSKAFTTYGMGLLMDEGKLDWDTPVREYLPDFRLYDEVATQLTTPRDLVSHRTGLPRHDMMWYGSAQDRKTIFDRLRHLKPSKTFRQAFQYNNLMFMAAGYLTGEIAGMSWEDFIQTRVFDVLGMKNSNLSVTKSETAENAALPYSNVTGEIKAIPFRNLDVVAPAGSINSNINEMLVWLKMHMEGGVHQGQRLIQEATLKETHSPQTVMKITPDMPWYGSSEIENTAYALGWATQTYRGHTMVRHTGGIDGFISSVSFFPNENFGVVVLTNVGETYLAISLALNIFDRMLGLDHFDWNSRFDSNKELLQDMHKKSVEDLVSARKADADPLHKLADYVGTYQHAGYGDMVIALEGDGLQATFNGIPFNLSPHNFDVFAATSPDEGDEFFLLVSFKTDQHGDVYSFSMGFEPTVDAIEFIKTNRDKQ